MLNYSIRVHSLLIPIEDGTILLPNANVAEVVHYTQPTPVKGAPAWLLGFIQWRELKIPLVSYETMIGKAASPETSGVKWVLVLNALGGKSDLPFFSIVVRGKPKLIQVDESIVTPMSKSPERGILSYVHVHGDPAIIPDPDLIESMLRSLKGK